MTAGLGDSPMREESLEFEIAVVWQTNADFIETARAVHPRLVFRLSNVDESVGFVPFVDGRCVGQVLH